MRDPRQAILGKPGPPGSPGDAIDVPDYSRRRIAAGCRPTRNRYDLRSWNLVYDIVSLVIASCQEAYRLVLPRRRARELAGSPTAQMLLSWDSDSTGSITGRCCSSSTLRSQKPAGKGWSNSAGSTCLVKLRSPGAPQSAPLRRPRVPSPPSPRGVRRLASIAMIRLSRWIRVPWWIRATGAARMLRRSRIHHGNCGSPVSGCEGGSGEAVTAHSPGSVVRSWPLNPARHINNRRGPEDGHGA